MLVRDIIRCSLRGVIVAVVLLLVTGIACILPHIRVKPKCTHKDKTTIKEIIRSTTQQMDEIWEPLHPNRSNDKDKPYCRFTLRCKIIKCSNIPKDLDPGEVTRIFIEEIFKVECRSNVIEQLILEGSKFPDNELPKMWLKTDVAIEELTFLSCSLITLNDEAFSSAIYNATKKLCLLNNNISVLKRDTFRHLRSLRDLSIRRNEVKQVERDLLTDVASTLQCIQFERAVANAEVLRNITGASPLPNVQLLSLRYNRIPVIDSRLLSGVPRVESLYLCNSDVNTVDANAFKPISAYVNQILMSGNSIASLPEGLFDAIIQRNPHFHLTIDNNPWRCDCNLKWMRDMVRDYPNITKAETLICETPEKNAGKSFANASFCGAATTDGVTTPDVDAATTASTSETSSTTGAEEKIRVKCDVVADRSFRSTRSRETFSRSYLEIPSGFRYFSARELENGTVLITLPDSRDVCLIWFANDARSSAASPEQSIRCVSGVRGSFSLQDLEPQTSYTVCSLDDSGFSPLNCLGVTTDPSLESESWLTGVGAGAVIAVFVASLLVMCLVSAVLMFVAVLRHPAMLRGSKRVVIVKRKALDAVVLPKGLSRPTIGTANRLAVPAISRNFKGNGHVAPLPPMRSYATRKDSRCSASSLQSDDNMSYISGVEPTLSLPHSWRLTSARYMNWEIEPPPPLPPYPRRNAPQPLTMARDLDDD